jgi:hypothetical protein
MVLAPAISVAAGNECKTAVGLEVKVLEGALAKVREVMRFKRLSLRTEEAREGLSPVFKAAHYQ